MLHCYSLSAAHSCSSALPHEHGVGRDIEQQHFLAPSSSGVAGVLGGWLHCAVWIQGLSRCSTRTPTGGPEPEPWPSTCVVRCCLSPNETRVVHLQSKPPS